MTEEGGTLVQILAFASAILSGIAAIAAISSAHWARRQAIAAESALARKGPVIKCLVYPVEDQPEWFTLRVRMSNPSEVPVVLQRATILWPPEWRMLDSDDATFHSDDGSFRPLNPLPVEKARRFDVEFGIEADSADSLPRPGRGHSADTAWGELYVHRSPLTISSKLLRLFSSYSLSRVSRAATKRAYRNGACDLVLLWIVSYTDEIDREIEIIQKVKIPSQTS